MGEGAVRRREAEADQPVLLRLLAEGGHGPERLQQGPVEQLLVEVRTVAAWRRLSVWNASTAVAPPQSP